MPVDALLEDALLDEALLEDALLDEALLDEALLDEPVDDDVPALQPLAVGSHLQGTHAEPCGSRRQPAP